ncbi:MAG: prolyl oligopeptidase family serine peptidase [Mariniblastus sp.]|nr:prolyl oligopeptidase family serine peptidase [Mariniblastus sp.]
MMQSFHVRFFLFIGLCLATTPGMAQTDGQETEANQSPQSLELANSDGKLHYWLFLPAGYEPADAKTKWPLMIFLHGHGERGNDLAKVKLWGPPKRVISQPDFPFVVVSPQLTDQVHSWQMGPLEELVKHSIDSLNVDPSRVYLTGLSMGGRGSWALAARMPNQFAAVIPICGGGKPKTAGTLVDVPIWAFHGDADRVVPVTETTAMVKAIKEKGGKKAKMTIYPGVRHNSWSQTYANPEIYKWLLQQKREN